MATTTEEAQQTRRTLVGAFRAANKTIVNFWLDVAMLVIFLALVWVSTATRFLFPPATTARDWSLWGLSIDDWLQIQFVLVALFSFSVLIHLMLHWTWVCGVIASRFMRRGDDGKHASMDDGTRTIVGVGFMIVVFNLLGGLMALAALSVTGP